jgi:hypothetical protein
MSPSIMTDIPRRNNCPCICAIHSTSVLQGGYMMQLQDSLMLIYICFISFAIQFAHLLALSSRCIYTYISGLPLALRMQSGTRRAR